MENNISFIDQEKLYERMHTLSDCLNINVNYINNNGDTLFFCGFPPQYCELLQKKVYKDSQCRQMYIKGGQIAYALGECYIFSCHAELNLIAYPVISRKLLLGTLILGPFLMDNPDNTLISNIADKRKLGIDICLELYDELRNLPIITPQRVSQISRLTTQLFEPILNDERSFLNEKQNKLMQQSRINENIQKYKGLQSENTSAYVYAKEKALLAKVKCCDIHEAKVLLNDLLGFVLFAQGQNLNLVVTRALELTTLLSRVSIEAGATTERILPLNETYLIHLQAAKNYEEVCFLLQEVVENFIQCISMPYSEKQNPIIQKAISYIAQHYDQPLSIQILADELHISPTYFSSLFSKHMNTGFQEYLTRIRIEEAKLLLSGTRFPINQIALSVGYADQSSFAKAFKRLTGNTPLQMR